MKLASLIAQFLYRHKRLELPGIGSFIMEGTTLPEPEPGKQPKPQGNIKFEYNPSIRESEELVNYIASESGKMKALAGADLDCHLELARQFLNIGKPFLFEGIGTLSKVPSGVYNFMAGAVIAEKVPEKMNKEQGESRAEEPMADYKSILYHKKPSFQWRRPIEFGLILAGMLLAVWGGYSIYQRNNHRNNGGVEQAATAELVSGKNTSDSLQSLPKTDSLQPVNYKFVVETAEKKRALKRYGYLRTNGLAIQMETADSLSFRLYFLIPAHSSDTTHILDSLRNFYTPPGKQAYVSK